MKRHLAGAAICAATFIACTIPARADIIATATLNAAQELNPATGMPPPSPATGYFTLDINTTTDAMNWTLTFSGLTSPTTMAHIHIGPPGISGAPIFMLYDYGMPPSMNMTSESLSGTLSLMNFLPDTLDGIATISDAMSQIEANNMYVNVHSTDFPAGEIRGQLLVDPAGMSAPEPASVTLMLCGLLLGAFGVFRRRASSSR